MHRHALCTLVLFCAAACAQTPVDNPVSAFYSGATGYPAWSDAIRWANVVDMSKYVDGNTNFEKFEHARDELAAKGGGVLYYPAGTYDFSAMPADGPSGRGLMLRRGVVIRGDAPQGKADALSGTLLATNAQSISSRFQRSARKAAAVSRGGAGLRRKQ